MSKLDQIKSWFQQHAICVVIILVVVLIAVIVVMGGKDKELIAYFGFACSLSGILLALVVIIHTWIGSADIRTTLTEMRMRIAESRTDIGKTADTMNQMRINMLESMFGKEQEPRKADTDTEQAEGFTFSISNIRTVNVLSLYCLVKGFQTSKEWNVGDLANIFVPKKAEDSADVNVGVEFLIIGTFLMFEGILGSKIINKPYRSSPIISEVPKEIQEAVEKEVKKRYEIQSTPELQTNFSRVKDNIDLYFTAS